MLVEIRRYTIKPGLRSRFVSWFEEEVIPAMEANGMRILGSFTSEDDPDVFFYLRGYTDDEERQRVSRAFYESAEWLDGMKEKALAMESGYHVDLVRSTTRSAL